MRSWSVRSRSDLFLLLLLVLQVISPVSKAQNADYKLIFGDNWLKAEAFVSENESWMKHELSKYNIPYAEAVAVIFPELVRYSALRDRMETVLLKTLYINLGDVYADFSVGPFQMKPSFAEKIRETVSTSPSIRLKLLLRRKERYRNIREFRSEIVSDLEDPRRELVYLIAFIKHCDRAFTVPEGEDRIRFLATAYNYSFGKTRDEIIKQQNSRFFTTKLVTTEYFSYSEISLYWYRKYLSQNNPVEQ